MITCQLCNQPTTPGEPTFRVVTEWREKKYPYREDAHKFRIEGHKEVKDDPGGVGYEIAKDVASCKSCYQEAMASIEKQQQEQGSW